MGQNTSEYYKRNITMFVLECLSRMHEDRPCFWGALPSTVNTLFEVVQAS